MKEDNCGRMPPCYSGKKFRIHEELEKIKAGDETHDMVYELNKQMCDIDKHLSEAGYFRMICDGQIETRKKLIDMEEKKTKKMTKAEAFEWLKGKKVNANGKSKEVQTKLFECGVGWATNHFVYYDFGDYLLIETDGRLYHCGYEGYSYWRAHYFEEISVDDILSIEIVDGEDNIAEKNAFLQARDIMKWLREKQSPHTLMIIDGNHVELLDGVKSEVWKE